MKHKVISLACICIISISVFVILSPSIFAPYRYTGNQANPETIDYTINQTHKISKLTPVVMTGLQVPFIQNMGQSDSKVKFYANTFAGTVFVTNNDLTYSIPDPSSKNTTFYNMKEDRTFSIIKENFANAKQFELTGIQKSNTAVNYFIGNNKQDWHTNVPTYNAVTLGTIWTGINLDLKAHGNNVEKVFTVNPGASVQNIQISMEGVKNLTIDDGQLLIHTAKGSISMTKPVAYQEIDGATKPVDASYVVSGTTYGFKIGNYDKSSPLVIDPLLGSTYIGGTGDEEGVGVAVSASGNVFVTGRTSGNYPTAGGPAQAAFGGTNDVFVSKLNSGLTSLLASTYIGGTGDDEGRAITLDGSGNVYVTGLTSGNYPTTTGPAFGGVFDVFVTKLNSGLTSLLASTYIGGTGDDEGFGVAVDSASGNVFVTGRTNGNYPTTVGPAFGGGIFDVFVSKLNSGLTAPAATYIGGTGDDEGFAITLDSSSNVYVTGLTSGNYPTTTGPAFGGGTFDVFVSKLNSGLTAPAATYIGGTGDEEGFGVALDSSGNVYVTGFTSSGDYPVTAGAFQPTFGGTFDVFVTKLNSALTSFLASTYIGGNGDDEGSAIALDSSGNVYVTGFTMGNYPVTNGIYQPTFGGTNDVFVSKLDSALKSLLASTYIGGTGDDEGSGIAISSGNVYVTGLTSGDYPVTGGAYQGAFGGSVHDVFVSSLDSSLGFVLHHSGDGAPSMIKPSFGGVGSMVFHDGLTIDNKVYDLANYTVTVPKNIAKVGNVMTIKIKQQAAFGPTYWQHIALYMNFKNSNDPQASDAQLFIVDDKSTGSQVYDPAGYVKDVNVTTTIDSTYIYTTFQFIPAKPMPDTSMIVSAWDQHRRVNNIHIMGAIQFGQDPIIVPYQKPEWLQIYNNVHDVDLAVENAGYIKPQIFGRIADVDQVWKGSDGGFVHWVFDSKNGMASIIILGKDENPVYQKTEVLQKASPKIQSEYSWDAQNQLSRANTEQLDKALKLEQAKVTITLQHLHYVNYFTHQTP